jgi:hypothetical protein
MIMAIINYTLKENLQNTLKIESEIIQAVFLLLTSGRWLHKDLDHAFLKEVNISTFEKSKGVFAVINENKSYTDSEIQAQDF